MERQEELITVIRTAIAEKVSLITAQTEEIKDLKVERRKYQKILKVLGGEETNHAQRK